MFAGALLQHLSFPRNCSGLVAKVDHSIIWRREAVDRGKELLTVDIFSLAYNVRYSTASTVFKGIRMRANTDSIFCAQFKLVNDNIRLIA